MKITLVGPRSVGKSTLGKLLSQFLHLEYCESDASMEKELASYGGLNKVIQLKATHLIAERAMPILLKIFEKPSFVLDLAGGAVTSTSYPEVSNQILNLIKEQSLVVGILPCLEDDQAITFLFEREKRREHFKEKDHDALLEEVKKNYLKLKPILLANSRFVFYVLGKSPQNILDEILQRIRSPLL